MESVFILCLLVIVTLGFVVYGVYRWLLKLYSRLLSKWENKVDRQSERLRMLRALNSRYQFFELQPEYVWSQRVNSPKKYSTFDLQRYLDSVIIENYEFIADILQKSQSNYYYYGIYQSEVQYAIPKEPWDLDVKECAIPQRIYRKIEDELVNKYLLNPVTIPLFACTVVYDSPGGRSHRVNRLCYPADRFISIIEIAVNKQQQRDAFENQRKNERSKMNVSMRYDIMKRDGFRCCICGRTANEGVKLHVDHILPVAKGRKTEPANLRTLCEFCNMGKSDKYDPYGMN